MCVCVCVCVMNLASGMIALPRSAQAAIGTPRLRVILGSPAAIGLENFLLPQTINFQVCKQIPPKSWFQRFEQFGPIHWGSPDYQSSRG